jgi:HD-GYP domain-containing protein (c-di-GMP phosphodiesterase class II)
MKRKKLKDIISRGILIRILLITGISLLGIYLWQILLEVQAATAMLRTTIVLFSSFLLMIIVLFLSLYYFVRKNLVDPLLAIHEANELSIIERGVIKDVHFDDIMIDEVQDIAQFRTDMTKALKENVKRSQLKAPLEEIYSEIHKLTEGIISALEQANLYNDDDTGSHMKRLGLYARHIGEKKGLPEEFIAEIERYSPLHDVGKIGIPDDILKKPGRLNKEEWAVMKTHSKIGYDILKSVGLSPLAQNIALFHHERWTGTGYPEGLKHEEIPIEARLVAIADVFDALVNERVYKPAFSRDKVEKIMYSEIGRHFDPELGKLAYDELDALYEIYEANCAEGK